MATKEQVQEALNLFEKGEAIPGKAVLLSEPSRCSLCPNPVALVDGKTKYGPWGNMCIPCFAKNGIGLGVGRGQVLIWKTSV